MNTQGSRGDARNHLRRTIPAIITQTALMLLCFNLAGNGHAQVGGFPGIKKKSGDNKVTPSGGQKDKDKVPGTKDDLKLVPLFGIEAKGRNFVIIADRSSSMLAGRKYWDYKRKRVVRGDKTSMDYLKEELLKTITICAKQNGQLYIYLYSSDVLKQPTKTYANRREIEKVKAWVKKVRPQGETNPDQAFEMAFRLKPTPDVIFFMSDGIIPKNTYKTVGRLQDKLPKNKRPLIHTIQLFVPGQDPASITMSRYDLLYGKQPLPASKQGLINRLKIDHLKVLQNPTYRQRAEQDRKYQLGQMRWIAEESGGPKGKLKIIDNIPKK